MINDLGSTLVLTADHGMTDIGTHGSAEPITREVAAFVRGPNIVSGVHTIATQLTPFLFVYEVPHARWL